MSVKDKIYEINDVMYSSDKTFQSLIYLADKIDAIMAEKSAEEKTEWRYYVIVDRDVVWRFNDKGGECIAESQENPYWHKSIETETDPRHISSTESEAFAIIESWKQPAEPDEPDLGVVEAALAALGVDPSEAPAVIAAACEKAEPLQSFGPQWKCKQCGGIVGMDETGILPFVCPHCDCDSSDGWERVEEKMAEPLPKWQQDLGDKIATLEAAAIQREELVADLEKTIDEMLPWAACAKAIEENELTVVSSAINSGEWHVRNYEQTHDQWGKTLIEAVSAAVAEKEKK